MLLFTLFWRQMAFMAAHVSVYIARAHGTNYNILSGILA